MNRTLSLSLFTAFVCLFFQFQVRAQAVEGPLKLNIIPPSPNSAALAKYVDFPTIPSSGVAPISLPLGSIAGKALSIPIALNYHAGGARVEEVASWVGQGWTLSGGGVITKTVRGLPDDVNTGMLIGFNYMAKK